MASIDTMSTFLQITALDTPVIGGISPASGTWNIRLQVNSKQSIVQIVDPLTAKREVGQAPDDSIKWYLEKHVREPFEAGKASTAMKLIRDFGNALAQQLCDSGTLSGKGHLQIEIATPDRGTAATVLAISSIQRLYWEVLEDIELWPVTHRFDSISVRRTTIATAAETKAGALISSSSGSGAHRRKIFRILLVVCRPRGARDIPYTLVSNCLLDVAERTSSSGFRVVVEILRPPTWEAFQARLCKYHYDLIHLDMHGRIHNKR